MLTGKAKTDYQREYMRRKRANVVSSKPFPPPMLLDPVRPVVRPEVDADGNPIYEEE